MTDSVDLSKLSWEEFELLVEILMLSSGYQIEQRAKRGVRGPDFEVTTPNGQHLLVEAKRFSHPPAGNQLFRAFGADVQRLRQQSPETQGLVVISADLPSATRQKLERDFGLTIWTRSEILKLLSQSPNIWSQFQSLLEARFQLNLRASVLRKSKSSPLQSHVERLRSIPVGRDGWRDYERIRTGASSKLCAPLQCWPLSSSIPTGRPSRPT